MEAKFSDTLAVFFFILFLAHQGSANEVDSLFGGDTSDKDAVLYTGIIVGVVSAFAVIFVIIALGLTYRAAKIIKRRVHPTPARDHWQGDVDHIIQDAQEMKSIPRASSIKAGSTPQDNSP